MIKVSNSILLLLLVIYFISACSKKEKKVVDQKHIVAIVGEDTIFVNDIIRRSEYTVRPPYCDNNQMYDKRIIMNSMIAEILYANEADERTIYRDNKIYNSRLQGIKEQLMREKLIQKDVVDKIIIPQKEIDQAYINSKKIVHTEAVFIPKGFDADVMYRAAQNGTSFDDLSIMYPGVSKKIVKDIQWGGIDEVAQEAIFSDDVKKGSVIKPLQAIDGYRLIKIKGWSEEIEMSPGNMNQKKETIKSKIKDYYIQNNYVEYAAKIMSGKRIDYHKKGWDILIDILMPLYIDDDIQNKNFQKELFNQRLTNGNDAILMNVDGKEWTIGEFMDAIRVHPLEINDHKLTKKSFPHKLQDAIASLITDTYLNNIAYAREYNKSYDVNRAVRQWDSYYKATFLRDSILEEEKFNDTLTINYLKAFKEHLNPYFEELKKKYDPIIRYNPKVLENIELTNLQTVTYKEKGPYKEVVPSFPLITDLNKTNYKYLQVPFNNNN